MKYERLQRYLEAPGRAENQWGWQALYDKALAARGGFSAAYLAGHYCALLDDLVELLGGPYAIQELIDAHRRCVRVEPQK